MIQYRKNDYRLACITLIATFLLIFVGGLVHSTGSSLACPDWPLCYDSAIPNMTGGIFYEHSHRLIATFVALLTLFLTIRLLFYWKHDRFFYKIGIGILLIEIIQVVFLISLGIYTSRLKLNNPLAPFDFTPWFILFLIGVFIVITTFIIAKKSSFFLPALGLLMSEIIIFQAGLGGLTVLLQLPKIVSITHLATSMFYLALVITCIFELRNNKTTQHKIKITQKNIMIPCIFVYIQILLGAMVRHTGSALSCGNSILMCKETLFGENYAQFLLSTHRFFAFIVAFISIYFSYFIYKKSCNTKNHFLKFCSLFAILLVLLQIILGILTIITYVSIKIATTHLVVGAFLWTIWIAIYNDIRIKQNTHKIN